MSSKGVNRCQSYQHKKHYLELDMCHRFCGEALFCKQPRNCADRFISNLINDKLLKQPCWNLPTCNTYLEILFSCSEDMGAEK